MKPLNGSDHPDPSSGGGSDASPAERWGRQLAGEVKMVLDRYPDADPEDVRLTLIALEASPLERLNRSLRRGRGFAAFRG